MTTRSKAAHRWGLARRTVLALLIGLPALWGGLAGGETEQVPLQVWGLSAGEPRFGWYALIELFERKHPDIDVQIGPEARGQDLQKLLCGVVGNSPPDVVRREASLLGAIAARDILMPLDEFVAADKANPEGLHEDDYLPGAWQSGMWNGHLYAIVEDLNPIILSYNRDLFRKAGLDPDRPPRTWDEWLDATKRLTVRDATGRIKILGTSAFFERDDISFYIAQCGGRVLSPDGRRCTLDTPEGRHALEFIKAMYDAQGGREACFEFEATLSGPEEYNPFNQGKIAMAVDDDWVLFRAMRFCPSMDLGIAPIPTPEGHRAISFSTTNTMYMIPRNAPHPREAWAFIRFVNSPDGQMAYAEAVAARGRTRGQQESYTGFRPARPTQAALTERFAPQDPRFRANYDRLERSLDLLVPAPVSPVVGSLRDEALRAKERASYNRMSVPEALQAAQRRIQEELDLYHEAESMPLFPWALAWAGLAALVAASAVGVFIHTRGSRARTGLQRRENRIGLLFVSPWALGVLLFIAGPMVFSLAISFCDYDVVHPPRFLGLRNYTRLLTNDPLAWTSLRNTAFMVLALPLGMAASLALALLLNTRVRGMSVYRTVYYLPAVTPTVAAAVLWYALLNPDGIINAGLSATLGRWLGLPSPAWLQDPAWAKPAVVLMGLWGAGGGMILWLAGLQGIPQQYYEAAAIDGAGALRRFRHITLPLLTPYIFFSLVVGIIATFQIFAQAVVLTKGGPDDSTLFYVYYLFNNAFRYFRMGYASAQAWVLFTIVLVLTIIQWRWSKRWVHYG